MTHLELLNVVLSWRFRQPSWPQVLVNSDYLVDGISVGLALADGRRTVPDVLASCASRGFTLLVEVKSGDQLDRDQLARMLALTPADLRDLNHLIIPDPLKHRIAILYVCNAADIDALARALDDSPVAVVGFDGRRFELRGVMADQILAGELGRAVVVDYAVPASIVPFDHESSLSTVARAVLTEVVAALARGSGSVTVDGLLRKTHYLVYEVMRPTGAKSELAQLHKRVAQVMQHAMRQHFAEWFERPAPEPTWRFRRALSGDPAAKTRDLKSLQKAAENLLAELGAPPRSGIQLGLFTELE